MLEVAQVPTLPPQQVEAGAVQDEQPLLIVLPMLQEEQLLAGMAGCE